ncbi:MAG TPA: glycosyltransferase family 4 protein [Candidatus Saccharimonadia bacterium]
MNIVWMSWKDREHPRAGGAEVVAEELAARLVAAGHTVTLLTSGFPGAAPTASRRGVAIIRTGGRFTTYFTTWRYFRQHRAELAADLVIDECNTMPYFAAWYAQVPTALFFHMLCRQIWFYEFPSVLAQLGYLAEPVYLRLLKRRQLTITVSQSTKADLLRHGFRAADIRVIAEGTHVKPVPSLGRQFSRPTVLSHGSVRPMKRTLDQVKAFEIAKSTIPTLQLVISGDLSGRYGQRLRRYVAASPYAPDIQLLGRTTDAEKIQLMRQCHAIAVTSVKEGWGLIVTEAASQGCPAVVYNVDGLRDAVRGGQTGLIVQRNTPAGLAAALIELLSDEARYAALRRAAWDWSHELTFDQAYADFVAALRSKKLLT